MYSEGLQSGVCRVSGWVTSRSAFLRPQNLGWPALPRVFLFSGHFLFWLSLSPGPPAYTPRALSSRPGLEKLARATFTLGAWGQGAGGRERAWRVWGPEGKRRGGEGVVGSPGE